ncbi:sigma-70 family RNA polymerase sigma factor [Aporhodopirellula aestuarii]|uniref:Sigma-70 family RNA polymerase sigma factor n=1 Tax=Aporhodopirellula aestuarii TaxID=2950107 RepID=A0ABT0UDW1_9BACT|nr:sigma-70 family RNA polymerase sigma factor [Aporhodopirellula aestuarii]MCM2374915.1 sigma-70 family RNA polymerase sigma factor [Aporhodopirellula aestuarii]
MPSKCLSEEEQRNQNFVKLVSQNDRAIRLYVRSLMPTNDGVDDVYQETMLECWKKFATFRQDPELKGVNQFLRWACAIARFKVLSRKRDYSRDKLVFHVDVIERLATGANDQVEQFQERTDAIQNCLSEMDESSRSLLLSVHRPGESVADVARKTGKQVRQLYYRIDRLRTILLQCVKRRMLEDCT